MSFGVDYAFNPHPPISALKAASCTFVCRYTSAESSNDANGKNLQPGECKALLAAGISVVVVCEEGATRMKGGHSAGVIDAGHADAVVTALGMPGIPIYFACDYDAPPGDQAAINAYLDGAASQITHARTGIYGGYWPVSRARAAGKASYFWGTIAWSGTNWAIADWTPHIMQGLTVGVGGTTVDVDHSHGADYGQWPLRTAPPPPPPPPPPPGTPVQRMADGNTSLRAALHAHGTGEVATGLELMLAAKASGRFGHIQRVYIDTGNWDAKMPAGMIYVTVS